MPNGHLDIGVGQGEATIWNPQVPIQNFNAILQQKKAREQADTDALAAELTKVKPDGLRNDADRESFFNKYQAIKDAAAPISTTRDPLKRAMLKSQTEQALLGLHDFVSRSKQQGADEHGLMTKIYDPMQRHNYTDTSVQDMLANRNLAIDDPKYKKDLSFLVRQPDHQKVDDIFDKAGQSALKQSQWSNPIQDAGIVTQGDKKGVVTYNQRQVSPEDLLAMQAHMYDVNNDIKQSLEQRYPQIQGANPNETKMLRIRQNAIDRGDITLNQDGSLESTVVEKGKPTFKANTAPDRFYAHHDYSAANPIGGNKLTPAQILTLGNTQAGVTGMINADQSAVNRFVNLAPKGQYGGAKPSMDIDPNTGEHVFKFPAQVVPDETAIKKINAAKVAYNAGKGVQKTGTVLGFGGTVVPFEKSDKGKAIIAANPIVKVKKPAAEYRLNPTDPDSYSGQTAQMAADQNIKLPQLNQIQGITGGHGQIKPITDPVNKHKKAASDYGL